LPWLTIRNLSYRGLTLDLRVSNRMVKLTSRQPGYDFVWTRRIDPGGRAVFTAPPYPVPGFPPKVQPASAWQARWIWAPGDPDKTPKAYFRKTLVLPAKPEAARVVVTADNAFKLAVNGQPVLTGDNWSQLYSADLSKALQAGTNIITIVGENAGGPGGVLLQGTIRAGGKTLTLATDTTWRVMTVTPPKSWQLDGINDSDWPLAVDLGAPPTDPWGNVGDPGL
jgi:hypothetical protein